MPLYVLTGGKEGCKPTADERPVPSLKELWDDYLASLPTGAKEESSLKTEKGHFNHLLRILNGVLHIGRVKEFLDFVRLKPACRDGFTPPSSLSPIRVADVER